MTKSEIMKTANQIIGALHNCDDVEFVDQVVSAVGCGFFFSADEIAEEQAKEGEAE